MITIHLNSTRLIFRYLNAVHSFRTFHCLFQLLWCRLIKCYSLAHFLLLFCLLSLVKQRHTRVIRYFELHISLPFLLHTIQRIISLKERNIKHTSVALQSIQHWVELNVSTWFTSLWKGCKNYVCIHKKHDVLHLCKISSNTFWKHSVFQTQL